MSKRFFNFFVISLSAIIGILFSVFFHSKVISPVIEQKRIFHYPEAFVKRLQNDPRAGEKIYNEYCSVCHASNPIVAVGAPRRGKAQDWTAYKKLSAKQLFKLVADGGGPMPARGGCFECDDALLMQAIKYLKH